MVMQAGVKLRRNRLDSMRVGYVRSARFFVVVNVVVFSEMELISRHEVLYLVCRLLQKRKGRRAQPAR